MLSFARNPQFPVTSNLAFEPQVRNDRGGKDSAVQLGRANSFVRKILPLTY